MSNNNSLIEEYIQQQQELSAVEFFAKEHARADFPHQQKYYKTLIPVRTPEKGEQYAFEVDLDKCSGCKACVTGCHNRNGLDEAEIWREVGQLPAATYVKEARTPAGQFDFSYLQHITTACHHCLEPACLQGCPVKAYEKDPITGIVKHLDDQCFGCQYCTLKCPYGVPKYHKEKGIVRKCDMCTDRLQDGEAPACVQSCPNEAIQIKLVKTDEIKTSPSKHFGLKNSPDADYTKPTTSYVSKNPLPDTIPTEMTPNLQSQHSEWPLVLMLVFTQISVGGALWAITLLNSSPGTQLTALIASFICGAIGMGAAPLHLGRPQMMFRAFLGWRTSWLSREAMVFGGYMGFLSAWIAVTAIITFNIVLPAIGNIIPYFIFPLGLGSVISGFLGVLCSAMIYKDTPREWWNHPRTPGKFLLTTFLGTALFSWIHTALSGQNPAWNSALMVMFISGLKLFVEFNTLKSNSGLVVLTGKIMLGLQKTKTRLRFAAGLIGGIILPVLSLIIPNALPAFAVAGTLLIVAGEIIERSQFFSASVPPRMPGL